MWSQLGFRHLVTQYRQESGNYVESFTSQHLRPEDGHEIDAEEEDIIKWCSAALYVGGADTVSIVVAFPSVILILFKTVSALASFVLLMALHPDIQRRAQAEIDEVVGKDRLPTTADQVSLPYVSAVVKEVLRFAPVAPLGEIFAALYLYCTHSCSQAFLIVHREKMSTSGIAFRAVQPSSQIYG